VLHDVLLLLRSRVMDVRDRFLIGWFLGAVWMQNHTEETERSRVSEKPELCPECEAWRLPVAASAAAD
jgi:hypothetical protein